MIQLSMINPHTFFTLFARLKFFYKKSPFIGDFSRFAAVVVRCSQFNGEPQLLMWRTLNLINAHSNVTRAYLRYVVMMVPLLGSMG